MGTDLAGVVTAVGADVRSLGFEEAAFLPLVALTSRQAMLDIANIQPGHRSGPFPTIVCLCVRHLGKLTCLQPTSASHTGARGLPQLHIPVGVAVRRAKSAYKFCCAAAALAACAFGAAKEYTR